MIQLASLSKSFGERVLLEDVSWHIGRRERVALCGPNGAGKTTLLRMLAAMDEPDKGEILKPTNLTVGYLPQDGLDHSGRTLLDEAMLGFGPVLEMKAELHHLEERLGDTTVSEAEHDALLSRYSELQDRFRAADGYSLDLKVATVLRGLGFAQEDFDRPTETFSGGWQMRIALAKLLLGRPTLLLLDEPTNHLDLEARNWLEEYLAEYPHSVILVSHDRFFLDAVVTRITEIGLRVLTDYPGNYTEYLKERDERLERLRDAKKRQDEEVARVKAFIDRFRYQATKASQVQSRIKMLAKVVPIEIPPERKRVHFTFPACAKSGRTAIELSRASKRYGDKVVFDSVDLLIERGDRLALVGPNGAGKSTLMRLLSGVEPPDTGLRAEGHQVVAQYFAQDEATRLDPTLTVYETLETGSPTNLVPAIRNILGGFLFSGDDVYKKAGVLSGGERTRLAVARMLLRASNTLLLDEPTNHLDLDSKDVLLEALEDFGGTLIFVSHDRYFVDRLATKIVEVGGGGILVYPGTYEEFRWSKQSRNGQAAAASKQKSQVSSPKAHAANPKPQAPSPRSKSEVHADKRRADSRARQQYRAADAHKKKIEALEAKIADRERAIKELEASMAAPGFYDDRDAARPIIDRHQALMWEVGDLMHQWEELSTERHS
ncbi:MAG TPA: ABC-F family ATP-binding cassette domain-containing protein [Vicinamibacterales bacterium]|jgi:ATP-binding cassette subfamily F protein 3|nr:ABC-F family ATP-binding cassette domain-containing protein [Vicinamibacterales bacterium]